MALNIRKVVAQRAENNQKFIKRQFLYYFNRNCLFSLIQELYVRTIFYTMLTTLIILVKLFKRIAQLIKSFSFFR